MKRMSSFLLTLACLAATLASTGCATTRLETPTGFARHADSDSYDERVSDGEGVVIAVRTEKNRPRGDLAYWSAALDVQLRSTGYVQTDQLDLRSADGHPGRQLRYVVDEGGRELVYWLAVFVTNSRVVVVEAGGDATFFDPKAEQVEQALANLQVL